MSLPRLLRARSAAGRDSAVPGTARTDRPMSSHSRQKSKDAIRPDHHLRRPSQFGDGEEQQPARETDRSERNERRSAPEPRQQDESRDDRAENPSAHVQRIERAEASWQTCACRRRRWRSTNAGRSETRGPSAARWEKSPAGCRRSDRRATRPSGARAPASGCAARGPICASGPNERTAAMPIASSRPARIAIHFRRRSRNGVTM